MAISTDPNSWEGISRLAGSAEAAYPELVSAQWALESAWGTAFSGKNNPFGLKGKGTLVKTKEVVNGEEVTIEAEFLDFDSLEAAVRYLVNHWYKDFTSPSRKHFRGVNHAANRELAAKELVKQGYATDPEYAKKLIALMRDHQPESVPVSRESKPVVPPKALQPLFGIRAKRETWLKKRPEQADVLGEHEKVRVAPGRVYAVMRWDELPANVHAKVELDHGAGTWFIYEPHWELPKATGSGVSTPVDWADMGAKVSEYFCVGEVMQYDKRRMPTAGSGDEARILRMAQELDKVRKAWGGPLAVTSWYRPEPINQQVGGVPGSRHITGEAVDVYPVGRSLESFYQWIRVRWSGGLGDGRSRGFLHLDIRANGHFVPGAGVRPIREWNY